MTKKKIDEGLREIIKRCNCCGDCNIGNIVSSCKLAQRQCSNEAVKEIQSYLKKEGYRKVKHITTLIKEAKKEGTKIAILK